MAKHTAGPWDTRDDDKRITVGCGLVEGPNGYDVAEVYNDDCDRDEAWANARLIAAAPDLLAAAKRSLQGWDNAIELAIILPQHRNTATILADELRAAIAKATGKQENPDA